MKSLSFKGRVQYADYALSFDLELPGSGITALFGPSGAGKSTMLRAVAGLVRPIDGRIMIRDQVWQDDEKNIYIPTYKRPLGFVFQDARLFPHLTVEKNLQYGMKRVKTAISISLERAVELLGIGHLLGRMPETLSGGEKQRVSIARALATSPDIMMMDEPLAALDIKRKAEVIPYLQRLNTELKIPILYVSHALEEVSTLADYLVLLERGNVIASGPTGEMLTRLDLPLAHYDAASAIIEGEITETDMTYCLNTLTFPGGNIYLPGNRYTIGQKMRVRVQAKDVSLALQKISDTSILNIIETKIINLSKDAQGEVMAELDAGGTHLLSRITARSADSLNLEPGKTVYAQIKGIAVIDE